MRIGWDIIEVERYPKFDQITEFMNIALLPIGILCGLAMYGLASCATNFTSVKSQRSQLSIQAIEHGARSSNGVEWRTKRCAQASARDDRT